jgi:hypothetical protein
MKQYVVILGDVKNETARIIGPFSEATAKDYGIDLASCGVEHIAIAPMEPPDQRWVEAHEAAIRG